MFFISSFDSFNNRANLCGKYQIDTMRDGNIVANTAPNIPKYFVATITIGMERADCNPITTLLPFTSPKAKHS